MKSCDLNGVEITASEDEVQYTLRPRLRYGCLVREHKYCFLRFISDSQAPFGFSDDVFGDGIITAYLTPTHSAGSVIYKVLEHDKFALFVGANVYSEEPWEQSVLPGPSYHADNMKLSLKWITEQSAKAACIDVYCAHDPVDRWDLTEQAERQKDAVKGKR